MRLCCLLFSLIVLLEERVLLLKLPVCLLPSNPGVLGFFVLLKQGRQARGQDKGAVLGSPSMPALAPGMQQNAASQTLQRPLCCQAQLLGPSPSLRRQLDSVPFLCPLGQALPPGHSSKLRLQLLFPGSEAIVWHRPGLIAGFWSAVRVQRETGPWGLDPGWSLGCPWGLRVQRPG